jgi:hypothetical protein
MYCRRERNRKRYAEDPEYRRRRLAQNRAYAAANPAKVKEARRRRRANPETREKDLARSYGLSWEEYKALAARQGGACAICKKSGQRLFVDHCHKTGRVRGLLCNRCNIGLGYYQDDPRLMRTAMEYLKGFCGDEQVQDGFRCTQPMLRSPATPRSAGSSRR